MARRGGTGDGGDGAQENGHPYGESLDAATAAVASLILGDGPPGQPRGKEAAPQPSQDPDDIGADIERLFGDQTQAPPETGGDSEGLVLKDVAEKVGVSLEDLYKVRIPMPDEGDALTLAEIKDLATEHRRTAVERVEWETNRAEQTNAIANAVQELQQLAAMIPAEMRTPEMLRHAETRNAALKEMEAGRLLQRIPEFKDPARYTAAMEQMVPLVERYGFKPEELRSVLDHRLIAMVHDYARFDARIKELQRISKERAERKGSARTTGGAVTNSRTARRASGQRGQVEAVERFIKGN